MLTESSTATSPYAEEFRAFAEESRRGLVPANPILFYGSSSIRLWTQLTEQFPGWPVVNRGFGGSTLAECLAEFDRLVTPLQPKAIVCYAGDNDLDAGASPEQLLARFEQFMACVRARLGWKPVLFISIKPSPVRFWNIEKIRRANALIREAAEIRWREVQWLDVCRIMLDPAGNPRRDYFDDDGLHLSRTGYLLWGKAVRAAFAETGIGP
jgi:lysophospholipase L1-like esterase